MSKKKHKAKKKYGRENPNQTSQPIDDPSKIDRLPASYQELSDFFSKFGKKPFRPFDFRKETFLRIEKVTGRPLICYVAKTNNLAPGIPAHIDNSDVVGFGDLTRSVKGKGEAIDVFIVSNGGSAEAAERIVRLLREHFKEVRFIIPANAYSAATLLCFSGDEIIMDSMASLGPIDPQINGIPARAILRAFDNIEKRLKEEGPRALTAYMPLISKYDLHILEICKSAQELSYELARNWISTYMLKCSESDPRVTNIISFFSNYDIQKSHARSIDRKKAHDLGLSVVNVEKIEGLPDLIRSLYNQYELMFDKTSFFKVFENAWGICWGRQSQRVTFQLPAILPPVTPQPVPEPGPPERSG